MSTPTHAPPRTSRGGVGLPDPNAARLTGQRTEPMRTAIPGLSELDPRSLAILNASIASDVPLRTLVSCVMAPMIFAGGVRSRRGTEAFYAELTDARDASAVFAAPREVQ